MFAGQGDTVCDNGEIEETERRDDCPSTEVCVATTTSHTALTDFLSIPSSLPLPPS